MSRSIHTTRKSLARLKRRKFASDDARHEAIDEARAELDRKRRIKRSVKTERHQTQPAATPTTVATIPISVLDVGPCVHHAASPDDIRGVFGQLPANAVEGIDEVRLTLGSRYMAERHANLGGTPDPHTGRLGSQLFPGAYAGGVLGSYHPYRGRISIYAYVVQENRLPMPRLICDLYLRLHALKTLVHEVAHFHDHVARIQRGRWLADRFENFEWYAEKMEHKWTEEIVLPFLETTYPKECRALRSWVRLRGGIGLPLEFFAGDSRRTERNGDTRLVFSTSSAFESWLDELPTCITNEDGHLALAWELHYSDQYENCLKVLDGILKRQPAHSKARACRADTLIHLERSDEAIADADSALANNPLETVAWVARARVLEDRKDWNEQIDTCRRWASLPGATKRDRREASRYQATAHCALGDESATETCITRFLGTYRPSDHEGAKRREAFLRRRVYRCAGRPMADDPLAKLRQP